MSVSLCAHSVLCGREELSGVQAEAQRQGKDALRPQQQPQDPRCAAECCELQQGTKQCHMPPLSSSYGPKYVFTERGFWQPTPFLFVV